MRHDPVGATEPTQGGRSLRARCLLSVATGLGVLISAGCSGAYTAGGTVNSTITVAAVPGVDTAPIYLAEKDGYFTAAGLTHVVIKSYLSQAAELTALQSAQADIAASDYGDIFYAQSQNPDLRVLADGYDATQGALEVITMPGSPITSPGDLANKLVGVPDDQVLSRLCVHTGGPGCSGSSHPVSLETAAATQVLSNYLGNNDESVIWDPMSQPQEIAALQSGRLSAALLSEPYIYEAQSVLGASELLDACSGSTAGLPLTGYVAMKAWVKDNPDAVADFQTAIARAQTQAAMTGQVQQVLPKAAGMTAEEADLSVIGTYPAATSAIGLERVVRLMSNFDMIGSGAAPSVPPMIVKLGS